MKSSSMKKKRKEMVNKHCGFLIIPGLELLLHENELEYNLDIRYKHNMEEVL